MKQQIAIEGMSCSGCVRSVENALNQMDEVTKVTVSLEPPQAIIDAESAINTFRLQSVLSKAGNYSIAGSEKVKDNKKPGGCCCG